MLLITINIDIANQVQNEPSNVPPVPKASYSEPMGWESLSLPSFPSLSIRVNDLFSTFRSVPSVSVPSFNEYEW